MKLYIIIKSRITAAAVHKGTGSQTSNSASMVTIYEMTKDINDDMEPLTLMLMAILNFIYLFLPHSFRIVLYSDHRV